LLLERTFKSWEVVFFLFRDVLIEVLHESLEGGIKFGVLWLQLLKLGQSFLDLKSLSVVASDRTTVSNVPIGVHCGLYWP